MSMGINSRRRGRRERFGWLKRRARSELRWAMLRLLTSRSRLRKVGPRRLHHANIRQDRIRDRRRRNTRESYKQGGVLVDVEGDIGQRDDGVLIG